MNTTMKTRLRMTASELAAGRFMRAPDHDASTGAGGSSGDGNSLADDSNADSDAGLSTAQKLEKEFGQEITPEDDSDDGDEGAQSDDGDDGDESGDDDDEGADGDEGTLDDDGDDESDGDDQGEPEAAAKKNRAQERIDKLTNESRHYEREAEKWKQIAIDKGWTPDAGEGPTMPEEPDPEKYPYGEYDPDYLKARGAYDARAEMLQEQAKARFEAEAASLEAKWTKNLAGAAEKYPDFDEVVVQGSDKWPCPPVVALGIKDSDVGTDVAYHLAKNVEEAEAIAKLTPLEQARMFGRLEQKFIARAAKAARKASGEEAKDSKPKPPAKIATKAPPPPKRRVSGNGAPREIPADTDDFAAFERKADRILGMKKD